MADRKATILVVDDEQHTRELERRILAEGPYTVAQASDAAEALALLAHQRFDLVVADLEMPGLSGEEMVAKIRSTVPNQKVLYVSGVVDRLLDARQVLGDGEAFLDKPFTAKGLREAVSLLLYDTLTPPAR